jgi:hypothetical protein
MDTIKKTVISETTLASLGNAVLGAVGTYLALPKLEALPLFGGPESAGFALLPPSVGFPLIAVLLTTYLIGKKTAAGKIDTSSSQAVTWLPRNTLFTALLLTLISIVIFAPVAIGISWLVFGENLTFIQAMIVCVIYLIALAILIIPTVVRRAIHLASERILITP